MTTGDATALPPGFRIVLTDGRRQTPACRCPGCLPHANTRSQTTYVIETAPDDETSTYTRDEAVAEAWAAHRHRLVEQYLIPRSPVVYWRVDDRALDRLPAPVATDIRRFLATRARHTGEDPVERYIQFFPEHATAVRRALATGEIVGLPNYADAVWLDDTHEYRIRGDANPRVSRRRRGDRLFHLEFTGPFERYPDDVERPGGIHAGPTFTIGGRDVVAELHEDSYWHSVLITLDGTVLGSGKLVARLGSRGFGELTPGDSDELTVGDVDVMVAMLAYEDGDTVSLVVEQV